MDAKLERFLNAINFNKELYNYFDDASVKEVLLNKKTSKMTLILNMDNVLPIDVFSLLCESSKSLKGAKKVRFKIIRKEDNKYFKDYFNYYFDILVGKCPMLNSIDKDKIEIDSTTISINVLNKVEFDKIKSLEEKIESFLIDMGYSDIEIKVNIDEEERAKFKEKIKEDEPKKEKTKSAKLIKGKSIIGNQSFIKNLITNENNVIIIGKVFGVEARTTQSGWNILTIKITDFTDSIISNKIHHLLL